MKFLIPTEPDDTHAILVKVALENMGHQVRCIFTADQPTKQKNSVFIDTMGYQWKSADKYDSFFLDNDYDVVWWRRPNKPYVPTQSAHPDDYKFIVRENTLFYESLTDTLSPNAWWVNPKESAIRANSKLLQLKIAVESGLTIPTTLCSNSPEDIRYFLLRHEAEGVIYKPLCGNGWLEENKINMRYNPKITFLELPDNQLLQLSPGIFQKEIKQKHTLRITCFGDYLVGATLNAQSHEEGRYDWRAIRQDHLSIEPYSIPAKLAEQIRTFMRKMGLVFGSLDFIVTPNDEYIFLEVNEQGQFLWMEEYNLDFKMLDIFVNFLVSGTRKFEWRPQVLAHEIDQYRTDVSEIVARNRRYHVASNNAHVL